MPLAMPEKGSPLAATRLRRILQAERAEYVARRGDDHGFIARMAEPDGAKPALANQAYLGKLLAGKQTAVGVGVVELAMQRFDLRAGYFLDPDADVADPSIHRRSRPDPHDFPELEVEMAGSDLDDVHRAALRSIPFDLFVKPSTNDLRALIYAIGRLIPAAATPPRRDGPGDVRKALSK